MKKTDKYKESVRIKRIVNCSAVISAVLIFLIPPLYFSVSVYFSQKSILKTEAEINSRILGQIVALNPDYWEFQTTRYTEVLEYRRSDNTPENRLIISNNGNLVAESRDNILSPIISEETELYDSGKVIGKLIIERSTRSLIYNTLGIAVFCFFSAILFYYFMKQLPLKALSETLDNLFDEQTKLRVAEEKLSRANEILEQKVEETTRELNSKTQALVVSAKMSALGEMASGIAHEINNPLAVIMGKAQLSIKQLSSENPQLEKIKENQDRIVDVSKRIVKIIAGLKSFARDSSSDPMSFVSIKEIVEETLALCHERLIKDNVKFKFENKITEEYQMNGRSTEISQVILNLLGNAIDANEEKENKWITLTTELINQKMVIRLTDCGTGIPPSVVEKMMQPFFTTKEIGKGTGLGLSISKGIIETHGGVLYYDSSARNTTFVIELPLIVVTKAAA